MGELSNRSVASEHCERFLESKAKPPFGFPFPFRFGIQSFSWISESTLIVSILLSHILLSVLLLVHLYNLLIFRDTTHQRLPNGPPPDSRRSTAPKLCAVGVPDVRFRRRNTLPHGIPDTNAHAELPSRAGCTPASWVSHVFIHLLSVRLTPSSFFVVTSQVSSLRACTMRQKCSSRCSIRVVLG